MARKITRDYPNVDKSIYPNPRDAFDIEEQGTTVDIPESQQNGEGPEIINEADLRFKHFGIFGRRHFK